MDCRRRRRPGRSRRQPDATGRRRARVPAAMRRRPTTAAAPWGVERSVAVLAVIGCIPAGRAIAIATACPDAIVHAPPPGRVGGSAMAMASDSSVDR